MTPYPYPQRPKRIPNNFIRWHHVKSRCCTHSHSDQLEVLDVDSLPVGNCSPKLDHWRITFQCNKGEAKALFLSYCHKSFFFLHQNSGCCSCYFISRGLGEPGDHSRLVERKKLLRGLSRAQVVCYVNNESDSRFVNHKSVNSPNACWKKLNNIVTFPE